ncbi:hypothetical protein H4R18_000328 [Coemansia javaensis]|uniref:Ndc10 domain-containing protein n=1 Tax=Coemansia javaensis TaxID=2761396 RepID=A0A9W8HK27_9FUNG|nr:hypothetical protein H4R18_000328 [Coemansia javaensis]
MNAGGAAGSPHGAATLLQHLKESQELYQNCEFISKKTRSIYAWRAALWVRYCKENGMDFAVTEDKLIDYLDWLFDIDLVNKINTKKSYVPDILRDHMGSVICLWRIQTGNNPDLVSPKEGTRYQAKWDEILRNHPRRERFRQHSFAHDGHPAEPSAAAGSSSAAAAAALPRPPAGHPGTYAADALYRQPAGHPQHLHHQHQHTHQHHLQQQQQQQQQHTPLLQQQPHTPLLQQPQHSQRQHPPLPPPHRHQQPMSPSESPYQVQHDYGRAGGRPPAAQPHHAAAAAAAIAEPVEMAWQLQWMQSPSWAPTAARMLFTVAMATWTEARQVADLRLGDVCFGSSKMAPRLPSSVMQIALLAGSHARPAGPSAQAPAARQLFSIIRARNPLTCSWNAVASVLFHRWHIANTPPPPLDNGTWQAIPMLPVRVNAAAPPPDHAGAAAAMLSERQDLVRDLLPQHRLPTERVVRLHGLECARQMASPGSVSGSEIGDGGRRGSPVIAPLSNDGAPPDRLERLMAANSGYYEEYHCIQRHKVIPSEALQHTAVPAGVGIEERRSISRFLDFLLDMRIILLQDVAILKCCMDHLPPRFDAASILSEPMFNSLEFARYCELMQREAAEEIRALRYDLDVAAGGYDSARDGHHSARLAFGPAAAQDPPPLPQHGDGSMAAGSPHGRPFSPVVSPSPPLPGAPDMARNPTLFMDIPGIGIDAHMKGAPPAGPQVETSHSMPSRSMENWGDRFFESRGQTPGGSGSPAVFPAPGGSVRSMVRRRTGGPSTPLLPSASVLPQPGSPYSAVSPRTYWRSTHHQQRAARSPSRASQSPRINALALGGERSGPTVLPSISQFTQPVLAAKSPVQPGAAAAAPGQHQGGQRREINPLSLPAALRRSSDLAADSAASGMAPGRDTLTPSEIEQLSALREENTHLRERMQVLELTVAKRQEEMQSWMSRIEKRLMRNSDGE